LRLRAEAKTVFVHCAHAMARTPVVAAAYGVLVRGDSTAAALDRIPAMPTAQPRPSIGHRLTADNHERSDDW
jgi:protein-tyrosine phosphatase